MVGWLEKTQGYSALYSAKWLEDAGRWTDAGVEKNGFQYPLDLFLWDQVVKVVPSPGRLGGFL